MGDVPDPVGVEGQRGGGQVGGSNISPEEAANLYLQTEILYCTDQHHRISFHISNSVRISNIIPSSDSIGITEASLWRLLAQTRQTSTLSSVEPQA